MHAIITVIMTLDEFVSLNNYAEDIWNFLLKKNGQNDLDEMIKYIDLGLVNRYKYGTVYRINTEPYSAYHELYRLLNQKNYQDVFYIRIENPQNSLTLDALTKLAALIESGKYPHRKIPLGLSFCFLNTKINPEDGIKKIAEIITSSHCPQGLSIHLNECGLNDKNLNPLIEALKSGKCSEHIHLDLSWNPIRDNGIHQLTDAIANLSCPRGLSLKLQRIDISDKSAEHFAKAIASGKCPNELKIFLDDNFITDNGIKIISTAITSGNCPNSLSLILPMNQDAISEIYSSPECPFNLNISPSWKKAYIHTDGTTRCIQWMTTFSESLRHNTQLRHEQKAAEFKQNLTTYFYDDLCKIAFTYLYPVEYYHSNKLPAPTMNIPLSNANSTSPTSQKTPESAETKSDSIPIKKLPGLYDFVERETCKTRRISFFTTTSVQDYWKGLSITKQQEWIQKFADEENKKNTVCKYQRRQS